MSMGHIQAFESIFLLGEHVSCEFLENGKPKRDGLVLHVAV